MLLNKPQTTTIKWLFFLLLSIALFDVLVDVILRVIFDLTYEHKLVRITNWIISYAPTFLLWYFIREHVANKKAAEYGFIAIVLIALLRLADIFIPYLSKGLTPYAIINTIIYSIPFLVFGFVYHKNAKGLWYFIVYLIIAGIAMGNAYEINEFISGLFRYSSPFRKLFVFDEGGVFIAPMPMLFYKLMVIPQFIAFFYLHNAILSAENNAFQFKKLRISNLSNLEFSVVFWTSRMVILTLIFSLISRLERRWGIGAGNDQIQLYIWVVSIITAAYFFSLIYRNFLTSYFVSKGIKPGWKFIFINLPIINFFIWLYITFFVNLPENLSIGDKIDKVTALFKNSTKNDQIKVVFYIIIILGIVVRLIRGGSNIDPIVVGLISGVLSIVALALYFAYSRTATILFGLNALLLLIIPFAPSGVLTAVLIYNMIYTLLWISVFHFDVFTYDHDFSGEEGQQTISALDFGKKIAKPFEPKTLTEKQKSYWKMAFIGLIIAISIKIILLISKTDFGFSYVRDGYVLRLLASVFVLAVVVVYANNINTALKNKSPLSKTTKFLEIVSYGIAVWYLFAILGGTISLVATLFGGFELGISRISLSLLVLLLNIVLVATLIMIFIARYRYIGTYETSFNQVAFIAENLSIDKLKSQSFSSLEDRLVLCKTCNNRTMSAEGLLCSLTNERPAFETYCSDYVQDEKQAKRQIELSAQTKKGGFFGSWKGALVMALLGFIRAGLRGFDDPFGLIFLLLGMIWLITALASKKN
ncbi:hypothetical protein ABN763_18085 [Spongiivirga sp. MCCC 1A20706]|uniref:hypothetical protein n=1 Tax=Spongiivirga sp. MCCC 1A20706 TaxID=3160963 RepID=UPI003977B97C